MTGAANEGIEAAADSVATLVVEVLAAVASGLPEAADLVVEALDLLADPVSAVVVSGLLVEDSAVEALVLPVDSAVAAATIAVVALDR